MKAATWEGFAAAVMPDPFTVLGVRLRPFCIGHALLLQRIGNPLFTFPASSGAGLARTAEGTQHSSPDRDSGPPTLRSAHLIRALYVCRHPWTPDALNRRPGWRERSQYQRMALALRWDRRLLPLKAGLFRAYVHAATETVPDIWHTAEPTTGRPIATQGDGLPALVGLWLDLRRAGYTDTEAMNLPLGWAVWVITATAAAAGTARLMTETDRTLMQMAERMSSSSQLLAPSS